MAEWTCLNCVYARCDPGQWLRCFRRGESPVVQCANHPYWPGELHDVPGVPCRHYQPRPPEPAGDARWIALGDGHYALVDAADYDWLNRYNWHYLNGYAARRVKTQRIYMHRDIMRPPKGMTVDHINHEKLDYRRGNLRICTHQENVRNNVKHKGSSSRFKGVSPGKRRGTWFARVYCEGRRLTRGPFEDEAEAARAYDRLAVEYFHEFAQLNFPEEWPPERRRKVYDNHPHPPAEKAARPKRAKRKTARRKAKPTRKTKRPRAETPRRRSIKRKTTKKAGAKT